MSNVVWTMEIPSSSSGELYQVQGLDNGATTCTCRFGIMNKEIPAGERGCKHIRQALRQRDLGFQGTQLPAALTDAEIEFDKDAWLMRLCEIFSPVVHLKELVKATLREDNDHRARAERRQAGNRRLRPDPLPKLQRAVLEQLLDALSAFDRDDRVKSEADGVADTFLSKALRARQVSSVSNKMIAEAIRNSLCGNDTAWKNLISDNSDNKESPADSEDSEEDPASDPLRLTE